MIEHDVTRARPRPARRTLETEATRPSRLYQAQTIARRVAPAQARPARSDGGPHALAAAPKALDPDATRPLPQFAAANAGAPDGEPAEWLEARIRRGRLRARCAAVATAILALLALARALAPTAPAAAARPATRAAAPASAPSPAPARPAPSSAGARERRERIEAVGSLARTRSGVTAAAAPTPRAAAELLARGRYAEALAAYRALASAAPDNRAYTQVASALARRIEQDCLRRSQEGTPCAE